MYTRCRTIVTRMLFFAGAMGILAGAGTGDALAQRFEYTYGGNEADAGRGVRQVSDGGYIAVGETFSRPDGGFSDGDIYVVRTEADGSLAWSKSYNIGGFDIGLNVQEVKCSPDGRGGFIIVGYTDSRFSPCGFERDAFLLRIDDCGNLIWANTYGADYWEELGWDVTEACTPGTRESNTSIGDFIFAGYTTSTNLRDGYIVRVHWQTGAVIWGATYDGANHDEDYLYGIDEAVMNPADVTGDIVAAGSTANYSTGNTDGWIIRVDGNTGRFTRPSHTAATYGQSGIEEFRSIQELRYGTSSGDLVATGITTSMAGGTDVYVLQTGPNPCDYRNNLVFGDFGMLTDEAFCIREIPFSTAVASPGDLVITGYMRPPSGQGHGGDDAFLALVQSGSLVLLRPVMLYGGASGEAGWSVDAVTNAYKPECTSNGFVVAGLAVGGLYLIKTDDEMQDACSAMEYTVHEERISGRACVKVGVGTLNSRCSRYIAPQCLEWQNLICVDTDMPATCLLASCACVPDAPKPHLSDPAEAGGGVLSLSSYPNPVIVGGTISLRYAHAGEEGLAITVRDIAGRAVYTREEDAAGESGTLEIGTRGWTTGTYIITVGSGGRTASTRVVVAQ